MRTTASTRSLTADHGVRTPDSGHLEMVERKGLGHPDSICDSLAEEVSRALCRYYLQQFGRILHYNVDKALLRGGSSAPAFGGGQILEPIGIHIAGRAVTSIGSKVIPLDDIVRDVCFDWLTRNLRALEARRHVEVFNLVRRGSQDLVALFEEGGSELQLANDTSFGVGFAPFTRLERTVMATERYLTGEARESRPEVGEDVKVMGVRLGQVFRLTVSCAMIGRHVASLPDYAEKKAALADAVAKHLARLDLAVESVVVNAADDVSKGQVYLTVSGTSAEAGDDGQVGRGNRATGLITPYRPMTLEATAGKNPVTHVGKLYSEAAQALAERVVAKVDGVEAAECYLVSSIGRPVESPFACDVHVKLRDGTSLDSSMRRRIDETTDEALASINGAWRRFLG